MSAAPHRSSEFFEQTIRRLEADVARLTAENADLRRENERLDSIQEELQTHRLPYVAADGTITVCVSGTITEGVTCDHDWQQAQSTSDTTWECVKCHQYQYRAAPREEGKQP